MELLAKYVYTVYEEQSITKAARKLFISQPALSSAVSRHEKELGFRIFDRTTSPLSLTPEGQIYMNSLTDILLIEDDCRRKINAQVTLYNQEIAVGGSSTISYYLLPKICAELQQKEPFTQVMIDLGNVGERNNLLEKLRNGKLDFFLEYTLPPFECGATLLFEDELVIAIPHTIPISDTLREYAFSYEALLNHKTQTEKRVPDPSLFQNIPFPNYHIISELLSNKASELLGDYSISPLQIINSKNSIINHYLTRSGYYAILTTANAVKNIFTNEDNISYFLLSDVSAKRSIYLCRSPSKPLTPAMEAFLQAALTVCSNGDP